MTTIVRSSKELTSMKCAFGRLFRTLVLGGAVFWIGVFAWNTGMCAIKRTFDTIEAVAAPALASPLEAKAK